MASITIRNLDEELKVRLRVRAAENGRSMEEEARIILRTGLAESRRSPRNLGEVIHKRFAALGGFEMPKLPREPIRTPPKLDE
jgi:antitoxin FitA